MNKIAVPKEVHDAIEYFKYEQNETIASIYDRIIKIDHVIANEKKEYNSHYALKKWFNNNVINHSQLMRVLVCGTEVEFTPEEKIKERYENTNSYAKHSNYDYRSGMQYVLNTLNIKIKGVNT